MDNSADLISVIIPAFNAESTIIKAIDSAIEQKGVNVEVIVINDCSTDLTEKVIKQHFHKNDNVKLINTIKNSGPSYARNLAIKHSKGKWIAILDADDWFIPKRLSNLLKAIEGTNFELIADSYFLIKKLNLPPYQIKYSNLTDIDKLTKIDIKKFIQYGLGSLKPLIKKSFIINSGIRYKADVWRGEDLLFYVSLMLKGARFGFLNTPMYFRTESQDSLTRSDKFLLYKDLLSVFSYLHNKVAKTKNIDPQILKTILFRRKVIKDAQAAEKWLKWFKSPSFHNLPSLFSLARAVQHSIMRKHRFHQSNPN